MAFFRSPKPKATFSPTVRLGSNFGSCSKYPTLTPSAAHASPPNSLSNPAIILRSVDFPAPLTPKIPILAPGIKESVIPLKTSRPPG